MSLMGRGVSGFALAVSLAASIGMLLSQGQPGTAPGDGAPNSFIQGLFLQAFARGDFSTRVALPAAGKVRRDGPGYVQNFNGASATDGFTFAIAKPDSLENAFQMCCQILSLHASIGGFTAKVGFPTGDPIAGLQSPVDSASSLVQNFEGGHAIILHQAGSLAGQALFIRDPYVGRWRAAPALGLPLTLERDTTSRFSTTATQQDFQGGVIVQITSGARQNQLYVVSGTIYQRYSELGQVGSFLGYPIGDELAVSGRQRQNFEGGFVEYVPGSPAEAQSPVASVSIEAAAITLQVGNVITRTATAFDSRGAAVTGRPVAWTTSNRSVIQVEANGPTATLRAVGAGFANVTAFVDGVSSGVLRITVTSVCCLAGEGAPNPAVRQAIQDALARNSIAPRLPTDNPVRRFGAGYAQEFSSDAAGRVLVAKADAAPLAYVITGDRLARYLQTGGPAGPLGFAISDAGAALRQLFENHYALAGSPPILVAAPITPKWTQLGYEAGPAGGPRNEAASAGPTFLGSSGVSQVFAGGAFYGFTLGPRAGQAYLVAGPILARYVRLEGPAGLLGLPVSDAFGSAGRTQQNFEGGSIDFAAGEAEGQERLAARRPAVTVFPTQASAGSRVRISISGFTPGRRLLVTHGSTPDFEITPATGAFGFDQQIRPSAAPGLVRITARDPAASETAEASYRVRSGEETRYLLTKVSGDNQTALPASVAALPLVVRLTDDAGAPIAGARVVFASIAGAAVLGPLAATDPDGLAQARLRLPSSGGLVLATAEAAGRIVTFAARAEDGRLTTFPAFRQAIDDIPLGSGAASIHKKGSLLTALAALFRYYQDRGELPARNGLAEPAALNQFLLDGGYLSFPLGGRTELVVNLPRSLAFVSDAAEFESLAPEPDLIRDSLNFGRPVLLGLMLRSAGQDRGAHYVVATGVAPDGSILLYDPSPDWNRTNLGEYLNGFSALSRTWSARLLHGLRLRVGPRSRRGFLVQGQAALAGSDAINGYLLRIPPLAAFDEFTPDTGQAAQLQYADGAASQYQMTVPEGSTVSVRGLTVVERLAAGVYRIEPQPDAVSVASQTVAAAAEGLRNAAGFGPRLAPGSLASLFGSGLGDRLGITVGGRSAFLLFSSPFQANLQIPFGLAPGPHPVEVASAFGAARFNVTLEEAAPGIFLLPPSAAAVLNQDGTLNAVLNPARRGTVLQVFTTGLGPVAPALDTGRPAPASPLSRAAAAVTATLDNRPAQVLFAGLAPGFIGLCQANVLVPPSLAPNPAAQLVLRAAGLDSNPAPVAVE